MSAEGYITIEADKRTAAQAQLARTVEGADDRLILPELIKDEDMEAEIKSRGKAALADPSNLALRIQLNLAVAVKRDLKYARSSSVFLSALGYHNRMRSMYDVGKLGVDAT
jgi:hypothetical protein